MINPNPNPSPLSPSAANVFDSNRRIKAALHHYLPRSRLRILLQSPRHHQQVRHHPIQLSRPLNRTPVPHFCPWRLSSRQIRVPPPRPLYSRHRQALLPRRTSLLPRHPLTPLLVALADTVFRHQPCPSKLTFFSLVVILAGAVGYVSTDSAFTLTAYSWAFAYLVTITTEMVYIKHMVMNLGLNTWGFVLYNNLLSLMIAPLFWFLTGENFEVFDALKSGSGSLFDPSALAAVGLSCVFGLAISFFGFAARKAVSATAFTVTGVVNKFLTVAINVLIWDKHASPFGLLCLLFTIVGGVLYQQSVTGPAPVQRDTTVDVEKNTGDYDDDGDDLEAERLLKGTLAS
ncbi:hypothetical protein Ahy_A06g030395 isoform A [Arachis hypogaea]|uniref:Sugar phosphate transporter domain-containing protein n=1 Tax=Arachis hypogaea TaxID=3818 RepID=A0A445CW59_ARAHY|nr:hypothetical protein Ahy_A06g030395 isoform A [Arachis hypogaea]